MEYVSLGDTVKDIVSGYVGIVTARTTYLNVNNVRVLVTANRLDEKGDIKEFWIDELRLQKI